MADQRFFTGQKVILVSGGPVMTVMGTNANSFRPNMYVCQWFSGKTLKQGEFPAQNLRLATAEDEVPKRRATRAKPGGFYIGGR